jgi:catechol 2,3-dioxygenase-like lactoylglutathione lyase family enzyme
MGLRKIRHVRVPVTDLRRSAGWYRRLLDLELVGEFVEQGELRGIVLVDKAGAYGIALRDREYCASRPNLAGFDAFALEADDLETLRQLARRCDELGIATTASKTGAPMAPASTSPTPTARSCGSWPTTPSAPVPSWASSSPPTALRRSTRPHAFNKANAIWLAPRTGTSARDLRSIRRVCDPRILGRLLTLQSGQHAQ